MTSSSHDRRELYVEASDVQAARRVPLQPGRAGWRAQHLARLVAREPAIRTTPDNSDLLPLRKGKTKIRMEHPRF